MLDNGAFSTKTRGLEFNLTGFYEWVEPLLAHPHWAVVPDVIDGTVEQQKEMVKKLDQYDEEEFDRSEEDSEEGA